jgi:hypothetical protein
LQFSTITLPKSKILAVAAVDAKKKFNAKIDSDAKIGMDPKISIDMKIGNQFFISLTY